jgi:hypothetical protein
MVVSRRQRVTDIFRDAQTYLHVRVKNSEVTNQFKLAKAPVKKWLEANGEEDDDGNLIYEFPREVVGGDEKVYSGVMLRKSVGQSFMVDDEVQAFIKKHKSANVRDAYGRVFKYVEVLQPEELYVLQQEGHITERELRKLLHDPPAQYALWPIEAEEVLEGDDA